MINFATLAKEVNNTIEYIYPKTSASIVEYTSEQTVEEKLQELDAAVSSVGSTISVDYYNKNEVDDLIYTTISLNAYINIGTSASGSSTTCLAENGSSNSVTVKWVCSRTVGSAVPKAVTIDGVAQTVNSSQGTATFNNVTANKSYSVAATDQHNTVSKSVSISFTNKVYFGAKATGTLNSAFLLSLDSTLQTSRGKTFTANVSSGMYAWYACPASYGTPSFSVGGFSGGFQLAGTIDFTNANGFTTSYNIYRSQNASLGSTTVVVS